MSCVDEIDICVVRGTTWSLDVGLSSSFSEVIEAPTEWKGVLVFREEQRDDLLAYLTLDASVEVLDDPLHGEQPAYLRFVASSTETSTLPDWSHVAYCELEQTGPSVTPVRQRLFNAEVEIND